MRRALTHNLMLNQSVVTLEILVYHKTGSLALYYKNYFLETLLEKTNLNSCYYVLKGFQHE